MHSMWRGIWSASSVQVLAHLVSSRACFQKTKLINSQKRMIHCLRLVKVRMRLLWYFHFVSLFVVCMYFRYHYRFHFFYRPLLSFRFCFCFHSFSFYCLIIFYISVGSWRYWHLKAHFYISRWILLHLHVHTILETTLNCILVLISSGISTFREQKNHRSIISTGRLRANQRSWLRLDTARL